MRIDFSGDLTLTSDERQWIIAERRVYASGKHEGEEYLHTLGYYSDLGALLRGLLKKRTLRSEADTLEKLLEDVRRYREEVEDSLSLLRLR